MASPSLIAARRTQLNGTSGRARPISLRLGDPVTLQEWKMHGTQLNYSLHQERSQNQEGQAAFGFFTV